MNYFTFIDYSYNCYNEKLWQKKRQLLTLNTMMVVITPKNKIFTVLVKTSFTATTIQLNFLYDSVAIQYLIRVL